MERSEQMTSSRRDEASEERPPILNTTEARQGETSGHVRIVLVSALVLAFIAFILVYGLGTG